MRAISHANDDPAGSAKVVDSGVPEQARLNTEARLALAQEFGLLSGRVVASGAGSTAVSMSALAARWRRDGRVFTVKHVGVQQYPGFQFSKTGQPLAIMSPVIEAADGRVAGWGLALWFTGANGWLGGLRPVDVMDGPDQDLVGAAMRHLVAELL